MHKIKDLMCDDVGYCHAICKTNILHKRIVCHCVSNVKIASDTRSEKP